MAPLRETSWAADRGAGALALRILPEPCASSNLKRSSGKGQDIADDRVTGFDSACSWTDQYDVAQEIGAVCLKADVFLWISQNPGMDAKEVSDHFEISGQAAVFITEELLAEGLLDFDK